MRRGLPARVFERLVRGRHGILGKSSHLPLFLQEVLAMVSTFPATHTSRFNHSKAFHPPSWRAPWGTTAATWHGSSAKPGPLSLTLTMPQWPSSRRFHVRRVPWISVSLCLFCFFLWSSVLFCRSRRTALLGTSKGWPARRKKGGDH